MKNIHIWDGKVESGVTPFEACKADIISVTQSAEGYSIADDRRKSHVLNSCTARELFLLGAELGKNNNLQTVYFSQASDPIVRYNVEFFTMGLSLSRIAQGLDNKNFVYTAQDSNSCIGADVDLMSLCKFIGTFSNATGDQKIVVNKLINLCSNEAQRVIRYFLETDELHQGVRYADIIEMLPPESPSRPECRLHGGYFFMQKPNPVVFEAQYDKLFSEYPYNFGSGNYSDVGQQTQSLHQLLMQDIARQQDQALQLSSINTHVDTFCAAVQVEQAKIQAAQARMQAEQARMQAYIQAAKLLKDYKDMNADYNRLIINGIKGDIVYGMTRADCEEIGITLPNILNIILDISTDISITALTTIQLIQHIDERAKQGAVSEVENPSLDGLCASASSALPQPESAETAVASDRLCASASSVLPQLESAETAAAAELVQESQPPSYDVVSSYTWSIASPLVFFPNAAAADDRSEDSQLGGLASFQESE